MLTQVEFPSGVSRGSPTSTLQPDGIMDAVITDLPYYDNVSCADLSDFFYVWLKRSVGPLYPEHFSGQGTPKKNDAVSDAARDNGDQTRAKAAYEQMMSQSLAEAVRVLKPSGIITIVYAHKTTLGWATLVEALRRSGCEVVEAWPLDTERGARMIAMGTAALASSIFLVARKRDGQNSGNYEEHVRHDLELIVRERVETLWNMGISGADLVIACVGAGLRAITRFARVEFANGEEVPAERFLIEVETAVLESILARLSREVGGRSGQVSLAGLDAASRFYILWRYTYGAAELDAGEAIIFSNGTHVELDGPNGLATGSDKLVEKKKGKYRLRDFAAHR
jgi:putative DNA methylase